MLYVDDREKYALLKAVVLTIATLSLTLQGQMLAAKDAGANTTLRSGQHIILIRHALAPGMGDPGNFRLRDCTTQRNLSQSGRDQARRIGAKLRRYGLENARIFSSQWCRCLETAKLLGLGKVRELPALNSFFGRPSREKPQMRALREWLSKQSLDTPVVLVTHQVNITALSDIFPQSGEAIVMRRTSKGEWSLVDRLQTKTGR